MAIRFQCPACKARIKARDDQGGDTINCPSCGKPFVVPLPVLEVAPEPIAHSSMFGRERESLSVGHCIQCGQRLGHVFSCRWCKGRLCSEGCVEKHNELTKHDRQMALVGCFLIGGGLFVAAMVYAMIEALLKKLG